MESLSITFTSIENVRNELQVLLNRYNQFKDDKHFAGNEKQACASLILPLIRKILHWDTEDPTEFKTEESQSGKRLDYCVYNQGISQFIIEAKAPSKDIFDNVDYYKQTLEYGYGKNHKFAILTNFHQVVILGCQVKYRVPQETELARFNLTAITDDQLKLLLCFEKEYWIKTGKENILFSKLAHHKQSIPVDEQLLEDMKYWREQLLRNIKVHSRLNKYDFEDEDVFLHIEEEVQKFIDRLIFICYCEDKELHEPHLKRLLHEKKSRFYDKPSWLLTQVNGQFVEYRRIYNSDLFDLNDCDRFKIEDVIILKILEDLREPKEKIPYNFNSIEQDVLGKTYENFIGHIQKGKKRFTEKEDIGKRKKEGIYYTPKYIVDYIVNNTVREYIKGKNFQEIIQVRIVDPACGSGSFLLGVFDVLVEESAKSLQRRLTYEEKRELMLSCIYGVDLDKRACDIAKLNLSLKMAEQNKPLPLLKENIRQGNSLIDDKTIAGYNAFSWKEEFPAIFAQGGFDVVVGNPPYVRIQTLDKKQVDYFNKKYDSPEKNYDIYILFIEKGFKLLKEGGILGLILPHKFFQGESGEKIRTFISETKALHRIVDFGTNQVFNDAATYTCLLFLKKEKNKSFYYKSFKLGENFKELSAIKFEKRDLGILNNDKWNFSNDAIQKILTKINSTKNKFGLIAKKIFKGSSTGNDKIFLLDLICRKDSTSKVFSSALNKEIEIENALLHPFVYGEDIRRYSPVKSNKYLLFPYFSTSDTTTLIPINVLRSKFPKAFNYLNTLKKELLERKVELNNSNFYKYSAARSLSEYPQPKIMIPDMLISNRINYDEKGIFYHGPAIHSIVFNSEAKKYNPYFYLGILNSKLFWFFITNTSTALRGDTYRLTPEFLAPFCFPEISIRDNSYEKMIAKVDLMLQFHKRLNELKDKSTDEKAKIDTEITKTDQEIDELVYKLYSITEEEKKIIKESLR